MELSSCTYILLLSLVISIKGVNSVDGSVTDAATKEERESRASKRQVKLYSGIRAAPIVCNEEGFKEDPVDCGLFHRCVRTGRDRFVSFRFQCSPGTIYDPDTEICNHPKKTSRVACGGKSNEIERNDNEINHEIPTPISTKEPIVIRNQDRNFPTLNPFVSNNKLISKSTTIAVLLTKATTSEISNDNIYSMQSPSINLQSTSPKSISFIDHQTTSQAGEMCTSGGFMGDSENCRKFYRCVGNQRGGFIRYEFLCSDPTIWDEDKQACNHVWNVKRRRCGRGNMFENDNDNKSRIHTNIFSIIKSDEHDKEQNPYKQIQSQINYGSKVIQTQSQINNGTVNQNQTQINYENGQNVKQNQTQISYGTAISQSQSQINYGNKGTQTQLQINHLNDSSQMQSQVVNPISTTSITTNNSTYDVSSTTTQTSSNGCTASGFIGDTNDCKKFYRCVDNGKGTYIKYDFFCGEGTVWDPKLESCNHAWAVKECGAKDPSESSPQYTVEMENHSTTVRPSTIILSTASSTDNFYISKEPITEDNEISYGNQPTSSATSKPISTTSSTETYYTSKEPMKEENEISYGNQLSSSATSNPISPPSTLSTKPASGTHCKSSGFFGDNNDCKKFYRCVDNGNGQYIRYEFDCGEGTVWDSKIEACNHAWAVEKCGSNSNTDLEKDDLMPTKATQVTYPISPASNDKPNDDYDTGYVSQQEPMSEIITSSTTKITTDITTITTSTVSQIQDEGSKTECKSSGFIGDSKNCKRFYRCVDNGDGSYTKHEFSCGEGTVWDAKNQVCNHAWAVENCGESAVNDINEIKTTTYKGFENITSTTTISPISSTTNKTELQPTDNTLCKSNGFMGDNNDCKKFYRCVDDGNGGYTKYEFTCSDGTVWDPEINACNHAWAVQKCGGNGTYPETTTEAFHITNSQDSNTNSTQKDEYTEKPLQTTISSISSTIISTTDTNMKCKKNGYFVDKKNCKKFYRCVQDGQGGFTQYEFSCGEGTIWDQSIEACNHEWAVNNCTQSESYNNITEPTFTEVNYEGQESTEATSTTSFSNQSSSDICEKEGFYGDKYNCKKFYRCVINGQGGYTKYEFLCGDGTVWNQEIQGCDHESSDKSCKSQISTSSTKPESDNDEINTTSSTDSTVITSSEHYTETKEEQSSGDNCKSEGFYGDSQNCKKFYRCVDNGKGGYTKHEFSCGEGTIWVQEIQACDHDNDVVSCGNTHSTLKPQQATTDKVKSTTQKTSQGIDKENGDNSYETSSKPTSAQCTSEGFYGNQYDCTKFYRCVDNGQGSLVRYDFACGEGTAWDPNIGACNHISEVKNCENSNQQENQIMYEEEASQSTESTSTTKSSTASGDSSNSNNDVCKQEGYFGNTENCSKFYRCVDNGKGGFTKYDFDCGEGTIWDQDITTCNHPQDVNNPTCKNINGGTSSTESASTSGSIPQTTSNSDNQSTSSCEQENTSKKPESQNIKCEKAGYYAHPDDCKKFYRCVDWDGNGEKFSVFHFECGEGTIWDPQLDTCNHENSVYPPRNCSGTQGQGENMGQETTTTEQTASDSTTQEETAEQTTISEQTTQQSNPSEQTTTQHSTSTTQQTTTQESTTQQSTTDQAITEQTSTEKTTTKKTTTEQTTTEHTTPEKTTTEQTTTEQSTTEQTTTKQTTTEQTTTEQTTNAQTTTEQTNTEQTTTELTTAEQTTSEQTTTEQSTSENTTTEQTTENTTSASTDTAATENDSTTITTESDQETTTEESSEKECPDTEDDQYLYVCPTSFKRHPKYCNMFYQCIEDDESHEIKIATFTCPNNTIYDESKTQCVEEDKADKKCNGQRARKYRLKRLNSYTKYPIQGDGDKHTCPNSGYHPFDMKNECSLVFLKCSQTKSGKLRGYVYQCPEGYVYWSISKRCEKRESMKYCQESSSRNWTDRWEIPIERKNIAK